MMESKIADDSVDQELSRDARESITISICEANHFDIEGFEKNRTGRLSSRQTLNILEVVGIALSVCILVGWLVLTLPTGTYIKSGDLIKAIIPCGSTIAGFLLVLGLIYLGTRIGLERYNISSPRELPIRLLVVVDLLLGRVKIFEGRVSRKMTETTRRASSSGKTINYAFFYQPLETDTPLPGGGQPGDKGLCAFRVSEEGYNAFTVHPQQCRLYYLPLSKVIVNLEIL